MARPVRLREVAAADVDGAIAYYRSANDASAGAPIDAIQRGMERIARSPNVGTLRFAYELGIPGLRAWPLTGFPYIVFYLVGEDAIDVLRMLHQRRDVSASLDVSTR